MRQRFNWAETLWMIIALICIGGAMSATLAWALGMPRWVISGGILLAFPMTMPMLAFATWREERGLWMLAPVLLAIDCACIGGALSDLFRPVRSDGLIMSLVFAFWWSAGAAATVALGYANWRYQHRADWMTDDDSDSAGGWHPVSPRPGPSLLGAQASKGAPGQHVARSLPIR